MRIGKAYFGFPCKGPKLIDKYARDNTTEHFGPVLSMHTEKSQGLVLEVASEGLNYSTHQLNCSTHHKSGVTMRFSRISRAGTSLQLKPTARDTPSAAQLSP